MSYSKILLVCSIFLIPSVELAKGNEPAPNIIVMLADDMGLGDTSAYQDLTGNSDEDQVFTPGMERLARMGVCFTDAHTPSSRCSPTRYGLLTGRYPWRNRLKHWVLFGVQGDPMIERDRPTIATMLKENGYATAMVGKWHVGLRYQNSDGKPADAWNDADLTEPLFDTPLDHGFDQCWLTSRSHGTSGPQPNTRKNSPKQSTGPGHIHGRIAVGATGDGKKLVDDGPNTYVLEELGGRHSDHAIEFIDQYLNQRASSAKPFFLYYASNSNHGPHTPDSHIGGQPVDKAGRNVAGQYMNTRSDYIYENDVALSRLLDHLENHDDPRRPGHKLIENTLVIFTSDNGAEKDANTATGPWRSHKGSCYEGGHRVPFIVACPAAGIGNGDDSTPGETNDSLLGLTDLYATFAQLVGDELPDLRDGEKGAEDSISALAAMQGKQRDSRPLFFNDHKQSKPDPAVAVMRLDNPLVNGQKFEGQWKIFFDASLLRFGEINSVELYDLKSDPQEEHNRINDEHLHPLIEHLENVASLHRNSGGHRYAEIASEHRETFDFRLSDASDSLGYAMNESHSESSVVTDDDLELSMTILARSPSSRVKPVFHANPRGIGISAGKFKQVDDGEWIMVTFSRDVIIESAAIVAGNGQCGGYYRVGNNSPLAIYCVDADLDAKDQSGILSDIGLVKAGVPVRFDSSPHYGADPPGRWRLQSLTVRLLESP